MPIMLQDTGPDGQPLLKPVSDEQMRAALKMPSSIARPKPEPPKSWPETIADLLSMAPFMYGGPETEPLAPLLKKGLYAGGRAALMGLETVGSDIISAGGRKVAGKPAGLTIPGEAERFAQGTGLGLVFEGGRPVIKKLTGEKGATAAGTKAVKEQAKGKAVRSELGATAPGVAPEIVNQETRASQNSLANSINAIHSDINQGYKDLFAPYVKNPVKADTFKIPLASVQADLQSTGRAAQVSAKARTLLDDALELGNADPLKRLIPPEEYQALTKTQRINMLDNFSDATIQKLGPVTATVDQVLALQNRANDVLRGASENATSKSVAASVMKSTTDALDELGETAFLNPAEKEKLAQLKGRTRSFYTDFGPIMRKLWRTQTPEVIGKELFEKQPTHVVEQVITSATEKGNLDGLQRAFADYVAPEGAPLLGEKAVIPKLAEMDKKGLLQKLYPGRYGRIGAWLDTASAQKRLEGLAKSPAIQAQIADGLRGAMNSPEGQIFRNAAQESLKPGGGQMVPSFVKRWLGLYQVVYAVELGRGMYAHNMPLAALAFGSFVADEGFRAALSNDTFRERYYKAIMNPNVKQQAYSLARLLMGAAAYELKSASQPTAAPTPAPGGP